MFGQSDIATERKPYFEWMLEEMKKVPLSIWILFILSLAIYFGFLDLFIPSRKPRRQSGKPQRRR